MGRVVRWAGQSRERARRFARKFVGTPVLPALGATKVVETIVPHTTFGWGTYTVIVTAAWIFADDVQRAGERAAETVDEVVEESDG